MVVIVIKYTFIHTLSFNRRAILKAPSCSEAGSFGFDY